MLKIDRCKPLSFQLKLNRRTKKHYRCFIFRDPEELRAFAREQDKILGYRSRWNKTLGCARWFGGSTPAAKPNQIGVVLLCRQHIGVGIVSHEMTHAALYAINRGVWSVPKKGPHYMKLTDAQDERQAWLVGWFCVQFYDWYYRQKGASGRP